MISTRGSHDPLSADLRRQLARWPRSNRGNRRLVTRGDVPRTSSRRSIHRSAAISGCSAPGGKAHYQPRPGERRPTCGASSPSRDRGDLPARGDALSDRGACTRGRGPGLTNLVETTPEGTSRRASVGAGQRRPASLRTVRRPGVEPRSRRFDRGGWGERRNGTIATVSGLTDWAR